MKPTTPRDHLGVALVLISVVACGGSSPPATEPVSMPTPIPDTSSQTSVETTSAGGTTTPVEATAPPSSDAPAPAAPSPSAVAPQAPPAKPYAAGPCDACTGKVTPELQEALLQRAKRARHCYERVLTNNAAARASLNVDIRVGRDGSSCDSVIQADKPDYPGLSDCVVTEYRKGGFPHPEGGSCVQARVPILFTPKVQ